MKGALALSATRRRVLPGWAIAVGIAALFLGIVGVARLTGNWHTEVDPRVYEAMTPRVSQLDDPR